MARPRREIIAPEITRYYHIRSRCVRGAFLLMQQDDRRRRSAYERVKLLEAVFAVDVISLSLMDNHFHLILRMNPEEAEAWSPRDVVERWARVHPPRNGSWTALELTEKWFVEQQADEVSVEHRRQKLADISQYMKDLNQEIAQKANREDGVTGHFWAERFRSVALMDEGALLAAMAYVDLNPFAAGRCAVPEQGEFTSLKERADAYRAALERGCNRLALDPVEQTAKAEAEADSSGWLVPLHSRTTVSEVKGHARPRRGLLRELRLSDYLQLVDAAARLIRDGKAHLDQRVRPILERLKVDVSHFADLFRRIQAGQVRGYALGLAHIG